MTKKEYDYTKNYRDGRTESATVSFRKAESFTEWMHENNRKYARGESDYRITT